MKKQKQVFTCDVCHYIFAAAEPCTQCPDCGKTNVRPASAEERQEFEDQKKHAEAWK